MAEQAIALRAPFPWFGGKSRAASLVWDHFGDVAHYAEPFAGSLAVLLRRPPTHRRRLETVNDLDCHICNFWRSVQADPEAVITAADWPISEPDLHARHAYLVEWLTPERREHFMCDPTYCEPKLAGWWVWGISQWIGGGWCEDLAARRASRQPPQLGPSSNGIHKSTWRKRPITADGKGRDGVRGIHSRTLRKRPMIGALMNTPGVGCHVVVGDWTGLILALQERLRHVKIISGDWRRVLTTAAIGTPDQGGKVCGVFLDPPYLGTTGRQARLYAQDSLVIADEVRAWALENGERPQLRIALAGLAGEHDDLEAHGWAAVRWSAGGGRSHGEGEAAARRHLETIWFSPTCEARQMSFAMEATP